MDRCDCKRMLFTQLSDFSKTCGPMIAEPTEMRSWILGWGKECEVVAPRELRESILAELEEAAVVISPGGAYGASGEGFFRISLTTPDDRLLEAVERLRSL